jgi:DNA ligase-1
MLGSITRSLTDVYTKLGVGTPAHRAFVSEFKYDGQRVQIHARRVTEAAVGEDGKLGEEARTVRKQLDPQMRGKWMGEKGEYFVRLFSRHLEDMSSKVSEVAQLG